MKHGLVLLAALSSALVAHASQAPAPAAAVNYDESKVPTYTLPDPLVMADGRKVTDAKTWTEKRRPELLALFEANVYGKAPVGRPGRMTWEVVSEDRNARNGAAIEKTITLYFPNERDGSSRMRMNLYLTVPKTGQRAPIFLIAGVGRSGQPPALNQPVFARGYGTVYADIVALQPDQKDADGGYADSIRKFYAPSNQELPGESEWGALGVWAWSLSRAMDYLQSDKDLDPRRIYLNGVSRYGKAAMWAGAQDTRFAATFSGESGCGGAVIVRRQYGETVGAITGSFPHWFARRFTGFAGDVNALPVDWHELVALHAPRPVYIATAEDDRWGDPRGSFLSGRNADPVYALFDETGVGVDEMPPVSTRVGQRIGFHMRTGPHGQNDYDWTEFMAFADKQFGAPKLPR